MRDAFGVEKGLPSALRGAAGEALASKKPGGLVFGRVAMHHAGKDAARRVAIARKTPKKLSLGVTAKGKMAVIEVKNPKRAHHEDLATWNIESGQRQKNLLKERAEYHDRVLLGMKNDKFKWEKKNPRIPWSEVAPEYRPLP